MRLNQQLLMFCLLSAVQVACSVTIRGQKDSSSATPVPTVIPASGGGTLSFNLLELVSGQALDPQFFFKEGIGTAARLTSPSALVSLGSEIWVGSGNVLARFNPATGQLTRAAGLYGISGEVDGPGLSARFGFISSIATDGTDVFISDGIFIRKYQVSTGQVTRLAGSTQGYQDGPGATAQFYQPGGLTYHLGYLYVAETYKNVIRRVDPVTGAVTTVIGQNGVYGHVPGVGTAAQVGNPTALASVGAYLYFTDSGWISKYDPISGQVTTVVSGGTGWVDGTGNAIRFGWSNGLTSDGTSLYLSEQEGRVRRIVISSLTSDTLAGGYTAGDIEGIGPAARLADPGQLALWGGELYIADKTNNCIRKLNLSTKSMTTAVGSSVTAIQTLRDGTGADARFYSNIGIGGPTAHMSVTTMDGNNYFIVDARDHTVRKVVKSTGVVTTFAGSLAVYGSADGTGSAARFHHPDSITHDGTYLYVADSWNMTVRRIDPSTAQVTTIAGLAQSAGATDGIGSAARFYFPTAITSDGSFLYVIQADYVIRRIDLANNNVTTIAGATNVPGTTDGVGTAARFTDLRGLYYHSGALYIGDQNTIRKMVLASGQVTTVAGQFGISSLVDGVGTSARIGRAVNFAVSGNNLYFVDAGLRKMDLTNFTVSTVWNSNGQATEGDAYKTSSSFNAISLWGTDLLVYDGQSVRSLNLTSLQVSFIAGYSGRSWIGWTDGPGASAKFGQINAVSAGANSVYVADSGNYSIRRIDTANGVTSSLIGNGNYGPVDGIGTAASIGYLYDMTLMGDDLYLPEYYAGTLRKLNILTGVVSTVAGTLDVTGEQDGIGPAVQFGTLSSVTHDGTYVYVADDSNCTIRRFNPATREVVTLAGSSSDCTSVDGSGTAAHFNYLSKIRYHQGAIYIMDNVLLRRLNLADLSVVTLAGIQDNYTVSDGIGTAATFSWVIDLALDGQSAYLFEAGNHSLRRLDLTTREVTTLKTFNFGDSPGAFSGPLGLGTVNALTASPSGLWIATEGTLQRFR